MQLLGQTIGRVEGASDGTLSLLFLQMGTGSGVLTIPTTTCQAGPAGGDDTKCLVPPSPPLLVLALS
jgi:hypothetical protein